MLHQKVSGTVHSIHPRQQKYRTVFLDRDGVINRMRADYVTQPQQLELLPRAVEAIARISRTGRQVIVVTNQSGIARGRVSPATVDRIHAHLSLLVLKGGGCIRAFLICPHAPLDRCACRKPAPGLFFRARDELGVVLSNAVMVGDQVSDLQAARAAGCTAILVDPDRRIVGHQPVSGSIVVRSLQDAAEVICDA